MGKELRKDPRRKISTAGTIYSTNGKAIVNCVVRDVSVSGVQLTLVKEQDLPRKFILFMSSKVRRECTLVWQFSIMVGARFNAVNT